jgi:Ca2+-binding RTX toxin-like protein
MAAINLGGGNNSFTGTGSDEHINGQGGDDTINGGAGNDFINGGTDNDSLLGGLGNDNLQGGSGSDTLNGGVGNDVIETASGTDVIAFHFVLTEGAGHTEHFDYSGVVTQADLATQMTAFLRQFGVDVNSDNVVSVYDIGQNGGLPSIEGAQGLTFGDQVTISVKTGSNQHDRTIYTSVTTEGEDQLSSPDGHDVVNDFTWGTDKLHFDVSLTEAQFDHFFQLATADADTDGAVDDTVLALKDGTWSVTLLNVSGHSLHDFYTSIFS